MSDGKSTVSKKVSEFTSDNVGAVKLAQLDSTNQNTDFCVLYNKKFTTHTLIYKIFMVQYVTWR